MMFHKDKKEGNKGDEPSNKDVVEALKGLGTAFAEGFKSMNGNIQQLGQSLAEQAKASAKAPTDNPDDDPILPKDKAVDELTTQEILDAVTKTVERAIDDRVKKTESRLDQSELDAQKDRLKSEVAEVSKADPLFTVLQEKMTELIKENPALTNNIKHLLAIAKDENPEIVQEFVKAQEDEKNKKKEQEATPKFGGLMPGSSGAAPAGEESEKMDTKAASLKAWEETMADVPASVIGGNA